MKVRSLMGPQKIATIRETDDLGLASQVMMWWGVRHLPVLRGARLVGVVSERDVLAHLAEGGPSARRERIASVMTAPVLTVGPATDVAAAAQRMAAATVGCLPVVDRGRLVGMLTRSDILAHTAQRPAHPTASTPAVGRIMNRVPLTAAGDDALVDAASRMATHGVRHLPVVDGDRRVVGMLSDRDVRGAIGDPTHALQTARGTPRLHEMRVARTMSRPAFTVPADTPVGQVANYFIDRRIGAIPVVDADDTLVGIVSYVDVLRALLDAPRKTPRAPRQSLSPSSPA
jgi:CBS domain-containing protein